MQLLDFKSEATNRAVGGSNPSGRAINPYCLK